MISIKTSQQIGELYLFETHSPYRLRLEESNLFRNNDAICFFRDRFRIDIPQEKLKNAHTNYEALKLIASYITESDEDILIYIIEQYKRAYYDCKSSASTSSFTDSMFSNLPW
mgnify:FL=1